MVGAVWPIDIYAWVAKPFFVFGYRLSPGVFVPVTCRFADASLVVRGPKLDRILKESPNVRTRCG